MAVDGSGERLGKYDLIKRLGVGGMAEVFLAQTESIAGFKKQVVIKRVLPDFQHDGEFLEMFFDEARLAATLSHPNICQVFDLGEVEGNPFIAMEHIPGLSLNGLLGELGEREVMMPLPAVLRVMSQLLEALHYAHTMSDENGRPLGIIHRDVTPSNVMITPNGSVKLVDFGIARAANRRSRTQAGVAKGKLGFMAPEQLRTGELDLRVDIFGAATTLYVMETGRLPFEQLHPEHLLRSIVTGDYARPEELRPDLPPELSRITQKAMAPDRDERYRSALDMLADLERFAASAGLSMGPHALIQLMDERMHQTFKPAQRVFVGTAPTKPRGAPPVARKSPPKPVQLVPSPPPSPPAVTQPGNDLTRIVQRRPTPESMVATRVAPESQTVPETPQLPGQLSGVTPAMEPAMTGTTLRGANMPMPVAPARRGGLLVGFGVLALGLGVLAYGVVGLVNPQVPQAVPIVVEVPQPPAPAPVAAPVPAPAAVAVVEEPKAEEPIAEPPPVAAPTPPVVVKKPKPVGVPATGRLHVTSTEASTVRILGHDLGTTPLTLHLPVGTHKVSVIAPGGHVFDTQVKITADAETTLVAP